jgi:hypothetical protein
MSTSLQTLAADAHLAKGQFLLEEQTLNNTKSLIYRAGTRRPIIIIIIVFSTKASGSVVGKALKYSVSRVCCYVNSPSACLQEMIALLRAAESLGFVGI